MNDNDKKMPSENNLSDQDGPILLTEEVAPQEGDEKVIDLVDVAGDGFQENDATQAGSIEIAPGVSLSSEKFDRALEKTIERLYGEKIERMLVEVVQEKVSAEIEKIKQSLRDDGFDE